MAYFTERLTKKVTLPSNADYWVEIKTDLKYGELKRLINIDETDKAAASDGMLLIALASWNLDDESGNILEINQENVDRLNDDDVTAIMVEVGQIAGDDQSKKNS